MLQSGTGSKVLATVCYRPLLGLRYWQQSVTGQFWVLGTGDSMLQAGTRSKVLATVCNRSVLGLRDW